MTPAVRPARPFLLAFLPFLAYLVSWYYNGQLIPLLAVATIILLLWGGWVLWGRFREGLPWPRGFLPLFMLLWLAWFGISVTWSTVPYTSWFYFWTLGSLPLAFLVWILGRGGEEAWSWLWRGIVASAFVLCGIGLWQYFHLMAEGAGLFNLRPQGPLLDTNSFAAWMNLLFFPILVAFFRSDQDVPRPFLAKRVHGPTLLYLTLLALILLTLFSTNSRGGFLSWLCTMPFALYGLRRQPQAKAKMLAVLGLALLSMLLLGYPQGYDLLGHLAPGFVTSNLSTVARGLMWVATWHMWLAHPWLGVGLGGYFLYYPAYRLPAELASAGTYAHNDYIEYLAEGGPLNLLLLLVFAALLFYFLYRLLRRQAATELAEGSRFQALGLVLGVFAITGHALGNFIFYNLPLSLLAGLFLARAWQHLGERRWSEPLLPRIGINHAFIAQGALVVVLSLPVWALAWDGASYALFNGNQWLARVIPDGQDRLWFLLRSADVITATRPLATAPHVYLANTYLSLAAEKGVLDGDKRREFLEQALRQYRDSLRGIYRQSQVLNSMADLYLGYGHLLGLDRETARRKALALLRQALEYNPESVSIRAQLAQVAYLSQGDTQAALHLLEAGLDRPLFGYERDRLILIIAEMEWHNGEERRAIARLTALLRKDPAYEPAAALLRSILASQTALNRNSSGE